MTTLTRRDFLKLGGAAALSAAFSSFQAGSAGTIDPNLIYHGSRSYRRIAITYDDCYHVQELQQLIDVLAPYPAFHFTFFAIGDALEKDEAKQPGIWKRIFDQGHEIGYHTYNHEIYPSTRSMLDDFDRWMDELHRVLGTSPAVHFARPPGNDLTSSFRELCYQRGLVVTQFSTGYEASNIEDSMRLVSRTTNGDIVQMHVYQDPANNRNDLVISQKAVPYLAEQGFTLVTMSQLYDDLLLEQYNSDGCDVGTGASLTRTCMQ